VALVLVLVDKQLGFVVVVVVAHCGVEAEDDCLVLSRTVEVVDVVEAQQLDKMVGVGVVVEALVLALALDNDGLDEVRARALVLDDT
jgi:hypothetical protein